MNDVTNDLEQSTQNILEFFSELKAEYGLAPSVISTCDISPNQINIMPHSPCKCFNGAMFSAHAAI